MKSKLLITALVGSFSGLSSLPAAILMIADGTNPTGTPSVSSGGGTVVGFTSEQTFNGFQTFKFTTSPTAGKYAGVNYNVGAVQTLGADDTHLVVSLFTPSANPTIMNGFKFSLRAAGGAGELETNLSNANNTFWTLNGVAGDIANFTPNAWHTIVIDLSVNTNFGVGATTRGQWGFKSQDAALGPVLYYGDMRVIPEPSSMVLLGFGALGLLARRRR